MGVEIEGWHTCRTTLSSGYYGAGTIGKLTRNPWCPLVLWWTLQLQMLVAERSGRTLLTRTGRASLPCDCCLASAIHAQFHSLIMSDFLGHIEFLISPSQDHSGDRALECWTSCVWCMHIVQTCTKLTPPRLLTPVSRYPRKVPILCPLDVPADLIPIA